MISVGGGGMFPMDSLPEPMFPPALKVINNYKNRRVLVDTE